MVKLDDLSSNWKALQSKIQNDVSRPKKRRVDDGQAVHFTSSKRQRHQGFASGVNAEVLKGRGKAKDMDSRRSKSVEEKAPSASLALWAEDNDISSADLAQAYGTTTGKPEVAIVHEDHINEGLSPTASPGKYIALDCEMVGVGGPNCEMVGVGGPDIDPDVDPDVERSVLARVSFVNYHGIQVYDSYVRPGEAVSDWRTAVSGITPNNMVNARAFLEVQTDVAKLLEGRIVVGHALRHDFDALMLGHPKRDIRDTSRHKPFRQLSQGRTPSLKRLAKSILGIEIQGGEHSSIEDARACMLLFRRNKASFDSEHSQRFKIINEENTKVDGTDDVMDNKRAKKTTKKKKKKKKKK